MSPNQFRLLIIATTVSGIAGAAFDLVFTSAVPKTLSGALAANDVLVSTPLLVFLAILSFATLFIGLAATIGLFIFKPWAPRLAVVTTILALPTWVITGASVFSGWALALSELSTTLWGVVLGVTYFSQLKEKFIAAR